MFYNIQLIVFHLKDRNPNDLGQVQVVQEPRN